MGIVLGSPDEGDCQSVTMKNCVTKTHSGQFRAGPVAAIAEWINPMEPLLIDAAGLILINIQYSDAILGREVLSKGGEYHQRRSFDFLSVMVKWSVQRH